jgi:hypothetical protein
MAAFIPALAKAYAVNKAKDFATAKAEEAFGLPRDTIGAVVNPVGFAKNIAKDVAKDYAKDAILGREAIPEEDRSFPSSGGGGKTYTDDELSSGSSAYKRGGKVKTTAKSTPKVASASRRGDGIAQRGKTKGRYL